MTSTAAQTSYVPDLELALVDVHPNNPRHKATADEELIESVRASGLVQPIIVAPIPQRDGQIMQHYVLIAGHRRCEALKKVKRKTAPAVVRTDLVTEGQQVEAMLIENGRRKDLSAIEEAEGFHQLELFGYKQKAIATAVGCDPKTVSGRLRLLKLTKKCQTAVHDGQLTIEDALAIVGLDAKDQAELQKVAGTHEFKWKLEQAKRRKAGRENTAKAAEKLKRAGVPERELPPGISEWNLTDAEHGMTRLGATFSKEPDDHPGCLAFLIKQDHYYGAELVHVCTDVSSHDEQLSEDQKARRLQDEQEQKAHEEHQQAEEISKELRTTAVYGAVKPGIKLDGTLRTILRALLPTLLHRLDHSLLDDYFEGMGVPADRRWDRNIYSRKAKDADLFRDHIREIDDASDFLLAKALTTILVSAADGQDLLSYRPPGAWDELHLEHGLRYLELAKRCGHTLTEIDEEFVAFARGEDAADEAAS